MIGSFTWRLWFHRVTICSFARDHPADSEIIPPHVCCIRLIVSGRYTSDNRKHRRAPPRHTMKWVMGLWMKMWSSLVLKFWSVMIRSFTCRHRFHHVMVRSLACRVLFQHVIICSITCHHLFHHVVIGSIMWISVPSHREWSHKRPISIAHTFYKYTILFLFFDSMLLFLEATVDVMFYLLHSDQWISHSSALNECVKETIWVHPRTYVILCSFHVISDTNIILCVGALWCAWEWFHGMCNERGSCCPHGRCEHMQATSQLSWWNSKWMSHCDRYFSESFHWATLQNLHITCCLTPQSVFKQWWEINSNQIIFRS